MGTSTSSSGPGPGVSLDPPWLDGQPPPPPQDGNPPVLPPQGPRVAPPRRFAKAKRELGTFILTGDTGALGRSLGHYTRTGMGGAARVTARMAATTQAGGRLLGMLQAARAADPAISQWVTDLLATNPTPDDIADALVAAIAGAGGTADEEALKDCMAAAFAELLTDQPNLDLLNMGDDELWSVMQLFLGNAVCHRFEFDVGQKLESAKLDPALAVEREMQMRDFVKNEIGVQLIALRTVTPSPTGRQLERVMSDALQMTFSVFEASL